MSEGQKVVNVAVVDDCFAPFDTIDDYLLEEFFSEATSTPEGRSHLKKITGEEIGSADEIDDDTLQELFSKPQSRGPLDSAWEKVFGTYLQLHGPQHIKELLDALDERDATRCTTFSSTAWMAAAVG